MLSMHEKFGLINLIVFSPMLALAIGRQRVLAFAMALVSIAIGVYFLFSG